jgi:hypothetical protein
VCQNAERPISHLKGISISEARPRRAQGRQMSGRYTLITFASFVLLLYVKMHEESRIGFFYMPLFISQLLKKSPRVPFFNFPSLL